MKPLCVPRIGPQRHERARVVALERALDGAQVGEKVGRLAIRLAGGDGVTERLGARERAQRRGQARVDADEGATVRLVRALRRRVTRALGELRELTRDGRERATHRELAAELVHLGQIEPEGDLALTPERETHGVVDGVIAGFGSRSLFWCRYREWGARRDGLTGRELDLGE
jgi:hypothetical protein